MNRRNKPSGPEHPFYEAISTLQDKRECYQLLRDVCTPGELSAMEQRFDVAWMLHQGKTYTEILKATGASSAIISRVNRSLNEGTGAYDKIFTRMSEGK